MTVFKGYLRIMKSNLGTIIMYLVIFLTISIAIERIYLSTGMSEGFSASKLNVAVIDRDGGVIAQALRGMMERDQNLIEMEDDRQVIQEELYYSNVEYVLIVPEGAQEKLMKGETAVQSVTAPGSVKAYYVQAEVNNLLNQIRVYLSAGMELEQACERSLALGEEKPQVTLLDRNGNAGIRENYNYFLQYLPYPFTASSIMILGLVIMSFKKREIKNRLASSAVPFTHQTLAVVASFLLVGAVIWAIYMGIQAILYEGGIFASPHAGIYICNTLACILVALAFGFLTGTIANGPIALNGINNVISLGLSFLGGIFVPLEMLGDGVRNISQFLPTYWYSVINGILGDYSALSRELWDTVRNGLLIQILFAAACFGITLMIRKRQQQEV